MKIRLLLLVSAITLCTWSVHAQQQEPAPQPVTVRSGVMEGQMLKRVDPYYPEKARQRHLQGDVVLSAVIDKQGNIKNLKAVSGDPVLVDAAMDAVQQWKYRPYLLEGKPVEVKTIVTVRFHL